MPASISVPHKINFYLRKIGHKNCRIQSKENSNQCGFFAGSEAAIEEMVFNLSWFTPYITIFTHGAFAVSELLKAKLREHGYPLVETPIKQFLGQNHPLKAEFRNWRSLKINWVDY